MKWMIEVSEEVRDGNGKERGGDQSPRTHP